MHVFGSSAVKNDFKFSRTLRCIRALGKVKLHLKKFISDLLWVGLSTSLMGPKFIYG